MNLAKYFRASLKYSFDLTKLINGYRYLRCRNKRLIEVPYKPIAATVIIDSRCNLKCRMCVYNSRDTWRPKTPFWIDFEEFKRVADVLFKGGLLQLQICAIGEPFLNKDIFKMIEYVKKNNVSCSVMTNGSRIIENKIEQIVSSRLDSFHVDMDSGDPDEYEYIKAGAKWDILINNLRNLDRERKKQKSNMKIQVDSIIAKSNYKNFRKVLDQCSELNVDRVSISYLVPYGFNEFTSRENLITYEDKMILEEMNEMIEYGRRKGLELAVPLIFERDCTENMACSAPWFKVMVNMPNLAIPKEDWLGNVSIYCELQVYEEGMSFGNILKQPLDEVWNGPKMKDLRRRLLEGNPPRPCVENCPCYHRH